MNSPQPISTAPNRVVVLTNLGVAQRYTDGDWLLCQIDGSTVLDWDEQLIEIYPTLWTPLPDWMKP